MDRLTEELARLAAAAYGSGETELSDRLYLLLGNRAGLFDFSLKKRAAKQEDLRRQYIAKSIDFANKHCLADGGTTP